MNICKVCGILKSADAFETYYHSTQGKFRTRRECSECMYKKRRYKRKGMKLEKPANVVFAEDAGHIAPRNPNEYANDIQREQVHYLMNMMGWTYNDNGVWSKDNLKTKDNEWPNVKFNYEPEHKPRKKVRLNSGIPNKPRNLREDLRTPEALNDIYSMKQDGITFAKIAFKYDTSIVTITKLYNEEKKKRAD